VRTHSWQEIVAQSGVDPAKVEAEKVKVLAEGLVFDEIVDKLLGVKADHVFTDTTTCRCGYKPADERDWNRHVAEDQAMAILALGGAG
jgi:hypothetical protein